MTKSLLCSECRNGVVIFNVIEYIQFCAKCGKMRMCKEMGELN